MSKISVDTARLPLLLHELRLPAISRLWQDIPPGPIKRAGLPYTSSRHSPNLKWPSAQT